jgi:predicted membrane protein (TIGR00267 family)
MSKKKLNSLTLFLKKSKEYMEIAKVGEIARRYFVLNAFDGALTVLGIIMGSYLVGVKDPHIVIGASFGACLAMGVSGFWGAYMAEKAERTRALKDLEMALFINLKNTLLEKASKIATLWIAFVDGISPTVVALSAITPFLLSYTSLISFETAFYASITIILTILFILGAFLGKISRENIFLHGIRMVVVGLAIAAIFIVLNIAF